VSGEWWAKPIDSSFPCKRKFYQELLYSHIDFFLNNSFFFFLEKKEAKILRRSPSDKAAKKWLKIARSLQAGKLARKF
jgi:hypothetical protein